MGHGSITLCLQVECTRSESYTTCRYSVRMSNAADIVINIEVNMEHCGGNSWWDRWQIVIRIHFWQWGKEQGHHLVVKCCPTLHANILVMYYFHLHVTPASSPCPQLWTCSPLCGHWRRDPSVPVQSKLSSMMSPVPWPKWALEWAIAAPWYPSCRHATLASLMLHESSHTVCHRLPNHISTLPSYAALPPTRRTEPLE